jgi:hypothetical protein
MLETKFNEVQESHKKIMQAIQNEISTLRSDISAKDAQIN